MREVIVEGNVKARNPIRPLLARSRVETSIVIVATVEIDITRVAGDKAATQATAQDRFAIKISRRQARTE